jgi:replicative DNA helicase
VVAGPPPRNIDAERNTLSCCLLDRHDEAFCAAREVVRDPEYFLWPAHQQLWAAMCRAHEAQQPIDILTVGEQLRSVGQFEACGGGDYLIELTEINPTAANVRHYAEIVRDYHERRLVHESCVRGLQALSEKSGQEAMLLVQQHLARIDRTSDSARTVHVSQPLVEFLEKMEEQKVERSMMRTGILAFDKKIGGLPKRQLIYLSARGGEGKTTFAQLIARNVARDQGPVVYVSTEVDIEEMTRRYIAMDARVPGALLRTGSAADLLEVTEQVAGVHGRMRAYPLWLMQHYGPTFFDIEAEVRRVERLEQKPVVLVVLDRLEHVECGIEDETGKMNSNSRGAKRLQLKLQTTLMAMVQPNQDEKRRADQRPRLTDLAYSGRLRADAQMIIQLYRDSYDKRQDNKVEWSDAEAWVNKHNGGPTGRVMLRFFPAFPAYESGVEV